MGTRQRIKKAKAARYSKGAKGGNKKNHVRRVKIVKHSLWDKKTSTINNYKEMGIVVDPNRERGDKKKPQTAVKEVYHKELKETIENAIVKPQKPHMPLEEKFVLEKLIARHGKDNYERMSSDMKMNKYYWNKKQVENKVKQYEALEDNN